MFRAHIKLISAFLVLVIVASAGVWMYYAWSTYVQPSYQARKEILDLEKDPPVRIDVGLREFAKAMELMDQGEVAAAHRQLSALVRTYKDSAAYDDSRRILGEINMDQLLSDVRTPLKKEYVVASGDSLNRIAAQEKTTVDYIILVNALQGLTLQKGDQLLLCELNFSVTVSLGKMKLTLWKNGKSFKDYQILVARGVKEQDTEVESRSAYAGSRSVRVGESGYVESDKWITCGKGLNLRGYTQEVAVDESMVGLFLDVADIEELYTVLRNGSKVMIRN